MSLRYPVPYYGYGLDDATHRTGSYIIVDSTATYRVELAT